MDQIISNFIFTYIKGTRKQQIDATKTAQKRISLFNFDLIPHYLFTKTAWNDKTSKLIIESKYE